METLGRIMAAGERFYAPYLREQRQEMLMDPTWLPEPPIPRKEVARRALKAWDIATRNFHRTKPQEICYNDTEIACWSGAWLALARLLWPDVSGDLFGPCLTARGH